MTRLAPNDIKTHPIFERMFPIKPELLETIKRDMEESGFDYSQPIILARWNGQKDLVCIDGHTRLRAAIELGLKEVPSYAHELETEEEALERAIHLQRDRRNMTDAELMKCIAALDTIRDRGGDRKSEHRKSTPQDCGNESGRSASAKETATKVGCSARKVEQTRTVMKHGDDDTKEAVEKGEISINQAYNETQMRRKQAEGQNKSTSDTVKMEDETEAESDETSQAINAAPGEAFVPQIDARHAGEEQNEDADYVTVRIPRALHDSLSLWHEDVEALVAEAIDQFIANLDVVYEESAGPDIGTEQVA